MSKTPLFIRIARPTYGKWLNARNRVRTAGYDLLPKQGPYLILANHTHALDPFFISSSLSVHVRWVAGAYLFKNQFINMMLGRWIGGIAKQQGRSDLQTIRDISTAFKNQEIVGLFPEGTRTWDGEPVGFDMATAKLVRIFGVPVVLMNIEGGYAQRPRWARYRRRGEITLRVVEVVDPARLKRMPIAEILTLLQNRLYFSHSAWQERRRLGFPSLRRAEGLEKLLYLCPSCKQASTMVTEGARVRCSACQFTCELDDYDHVTVLSKEPHGIDSIPAWHNWERDELARIAFEGCNSGASGVNQSPFPPDPGVLLQRGIGKKLVTLSKRFTLTLESDCLRVRLQKPIARGPEQGESELEFSFSGMQSMIINAKSTVEFYHNDQLWRIRIVPDRSILKYVEFHTARMLQEKESLARKEVT